MSDEVRRFLIDATERGGHTHVVVRCGTARIDRRPDGEATGQTLGGTRAKCGDLVFRNEEWPQFRELLERGARGRTPETTPSDEPTIELEVVHRVEGEEA